MFGDVQVDNAGLDGIFHSRNTRLQVLHIITYCTHTNIWSSNYNCCKTFSDARYLRQIGYAFIDISLLVSRVMQKLLKTIFTGDTWAQEETVTF